MSSDFKFSRGKFSRIVLSTLLSVVLVSGVGCAQRTDGAQRTDIPRTVSGKPDMNGIWQALGNAHWDIEPHLARAALAMQPGPVVPVPAEEVLAFSAVGAVASGPGVVGGGLIP